MGTDAVGPQADDPRDRLIRAAIEGIATHGYHRVRLRDIGAIAGVTTGMIQHYFASREDLLLAAIDQLGTDQIETARGIGRDEPDPWRRLVALIDQITADPEAERRCTAWLDVCASASRDARIRVSLAQVTEEWRRYLTETIQAGFDTGVFTSPLDQGEIVDMLIAAIDGCELSIGSGTGVIDGPGVQRTLLRLAATLTGVSFPAEAPSGA